MRGPAVHSGESSASSATTSVADDPNTLNPSTHPAHATAQFFLPEPDTSFPTASAFPDFTPLVGFLQKVNTFAEIHFGLSFL